MLESICVYTLTAFFMYICAKINVSRCDFSRISNEAVLRQKFWNLEMTLSIALFAFIAGARYNVGVDHLSYLEYYNSIANEGWFVRREEYEPGFVFISTLFSKLGFHYFFYFAFWATLQIFFVYYALKNRKWLLPYVALSIMLGPYFLNWMNGIRQCVVECFFIFFCKYIQDRKLFAYLLCVVIATTIHKSAYILLPLYFVYYTKNINYNKYVCLMLVIACIVIGLIPTWLDMLNSSQSILEYMGYAGYASRLEIMTSENLRETAWGPSRLGLLFIDLCVIWYYPKMKNYFREDNMLYLYFFLFFIGTCAYNLFVNTSHIFLRPVEYFTIFRLIMSAYTLFYLRKNNKKLAYFVLLVIAFTYVYFIVYKSVYLPSGSTESNLFKFFFE